MSSIKLTNSVKIDACSLSVFPDVSNVLYSSGKFTSETRWTATEDCYVYVFTVDINNAVKVNNVDLMLGGHNNSGGVHLEFLLRKGDELYVWANNYGSGQNGGYIKALGLR